ncbi:carbonic anhydrase G-like protein [Dinothrombium tinctorium]|uniref:carbonic anhydrase n=1 Tax=Dinothrombium tinctorium TaxID=1965070 RepID=A0A3S3RVH7_9ACAR|nr:carbonic anhydrase G-like protein [Dinothrombium tinctorium]RWS06614.1 carbonic anhydrase G-like protein [Dinothrombium tinctorium]RWS06637.1 carbonic anhydrase G-like protein [Dinothrombium tinctorium]
MLNHIFIDESTWGGLCNTGRRQSPVDILTRGEEVQTIRSFSLNLTNFKTPESKPTIKNNGHSGFQIDLDRTPRYVTLTSSVDSNSAKYKLQQLHFHWNSKLHTGSEHFINGASSDMEAHFVTYNTKYPSFAVAANQPDGLLVIGVLYRIHAIPLTKLRAMTLVGNMTRNVISKDSTYTSSEPLYLTGLLPDLSRYSLSKPFNPSLLHDIIAHGMSFQSLNSPDFAVLPGSLTTPPCSENVIWVVFLDPLPITLQQKLPFLDVRTEYNNKEVPMENNRAPQPLYDRTITLAKSYYFYLD